MGAWVNSTTKPQYYPKKSMEYCLEMLIFTDLVPLEIVIKKIYCIYIFIFIFIFIYIGHLFVKHDLALICLDTRGRKKQRKSGRERVKEDLFPHAQRRLHTWMCTYAHTRRPTRTYTHTNTNTHTHGFYCCHWKQCVRLRLRDSFGRVIGELAVVRWS